MYSKPSIGDLRDQKPINFKHRALTPLVNLILALGILTVKLEASPFFRRWKWNILKKCACLMDIKCSSLLLPKRLPESSIARCLGGSLYALGYMGILNKTTPVKY